MPTKSTIPYTPGPLFSQQIIALKECRPDVKVTDQSVGDWIRGSASTGARIRDGSMDEQLQDLRHVLFTAGAESLISTLFDGTPYERPRLRRAAAPVDADGDGDHDKNDVAHLGAETIEQSVAKLRCIQRNNPGRFYSESARTELHDAGATIVRGVEQLLTNVDHLTVNGPRRTVG